MIKMSSVNIKENWAKIVPPCTVNLAQNLPSGATSMPISFLERLPEKNPLLRTLNKNNKYSLLKTIGTCSLNWVSTETKISLAFQKFYLLAAGLALERRFLCWTECLTYSEIWWWIFDVMRLYCIEWSWISCKIKGIIDSSKSQDILASNLVQQDNDPEYTSKSSKTW